VAGVDSLRCMSTPRIAVGPLAAPFATEAVVAGGGTVVEISQSPDALVWLDPADVKGLADQLQVAPDVRWVQLPFAGVEKVLSFGLLDHDRIWTCAKGSYAEPVAEHALMLALCGLRHMPARLAARSWGIPAGTSLYEQRVTILGGGGITSVLLEQLAPFRVDATVVRRKADPVAGAARTVPVTALHEVLPGSLVVFLALALTPETTGIIGAPELDLMDETAWLVNVARGGHVKTDALVAALTAGSIAGAALDVTDPEPLPDGHPLWNLENCIITPHTADTIDMVMPLLADRIRTNVGRFAAGEELVGLVDPDAGY
jgi:phosphoglycerate dehydrogenase-like enzyme